MRVLRYIGNVYNNSIIIYFLTFCSGRGEWLNLFSCCKSCFWEDVISMSTLKIRGFDYDDNDDDDYDNNNNYYNYCY